MNPISIQQATRLAALAVELRPVGGNPWDIAGVRAAIADVRLDHDAADICRAIITLAVDPSIRTPAVLSRAGVHWPARTRPTPVPPKFVAQPAPRDAASIARRGAEACRQALTEATR